MAVAPRPRSSSHGLQVIGILAVIGIGLLVWAAVIRAGVAPVLVLRP